jgi:tetratricopeptide (TPR) repeat protein
MPRFIWRPISGIFGNMIQWIFPIAVRACVILALTISIVGNATAADVANGPKHIDQRIQQLGDQSYFVRQKAQEELAKLGFEAFDALSEATTNDDLEIASRAKYLLRLMRVQWSTETDPPEVKKCLQDYEFDVPAAREAKMRVLAALPNEQGVAALCRLVRFERSPLLSKSAALALLNSRINAKAPDAAVIETVRKGLGDSKRPGATWLLAWTRLGSKPDAVMTEWNTLIENEQKQLRSDSHETTPEIVAGLIHFQIARLKQLGKTDQAMAAIRRLLDLQRGDLESLAELLDWLVDQKAWKAVDELSQRYPQQIAAEPGLLYLQAQAYAEQGQKEKADKTAALALKLYPNQQHRDLLRHLLAAQLLRERGQFVWARREFEQIITRAGNAKNDELMALAQSYLSEMLHDQEQDLDASKVLEGLVKAIDSGRVTETELNGRQPSEIRSRMLYFAACHWQKKGDAVQQREALDKALKADSGDIDVLIACYRLPKQTPEYHAEIVNLIKQEAANQQTMIAAEPDNPSPYNQYAWLIGNTEGDLDEAIRCSQKSLDLLQQMPEMKINQGGYCDTLAHVYFSKGDLENAVKQEAHAAELDPYSGLIQRELKLFRQKLKEKKEEKP